MNPKSYPTRAAATVAAQRAADADRQKRIVVAFPKSNGGDDRFYVEAYVVADALFYPKDPNVAVITPSPSTPVQGRRCAICRESFGVTWHVGVPSHLKCWNRFKATATADEFEQMRTTCAAQARGPQQFVPLVRVPRRFLSDHAERGLPTPTIYRFTKSHFWIATDDPHVGELLNDAEHYSDGVDAEYCPTGLIPSAKRTAAILRAATKGGATTTE